MTAPAEGIPTIEIRRTSGWRFLDLRELWTYRELIFFLVRRDVSVRYKQTAIGVAWAVLQPLALMTIFSLFFGRVANIPSEGIPYPIFALAGLLPWQLFSKALSDTTNSLVKDQRLVTRVYFPRVIVPLSATLASLVDFGVTFCLLLGVMALNGLRPTPEVIWLPVLLVLLLITALGVGLWLSALNMEYRDVGLTLPFLNQLWLYATPVLYPASLVPEQWRVVYSINPMVGVVEGFRWALLGVGHGPSPLLALSIVMSVGVFLSGIAWFRWRERTFIDVVGSR